MKECLIGNILFKDLNESEISRIAGRAKKKKYSKNEIIFLEQSQGSTLFLIVEGLIKIYKADENGREKTLSILGTGDFFGEMALLDEKARSASAQCLDDSMLILISGFS